MSVTEGRHRPGESRGAIGRFARGAVRLVWPTQRLLWTREGVLYLGIWMVLLILGLQQQINLILLVAGLAAGPVAASFVVSASMLKRLRVSRRAPPYAFSGDELVLDYTLENDRRWAAALALTVEDELSPVDRAVSGSAGLATRVFFNRVPGREKARVRWQGVSPKRGRYRFRALEVVTRSPFGLLERRVSLPEPGHLLVYPTVGRLTRRWHLAHRQATETRRGASQERSTQQQEYHGLRDYRPGDSPRWIHWRTTARLGVPMVKEFEQKSDQDLALLLDPWLPRTKVTAGQREALEQAVQFAATVCLETCRRSGRRILLGWTGPTPGLRQGPASVKLLHDMLEQLAVLHASSEGTLAALFDILTPSTLREANLVVISTRPVNLVEEAERSSRLSGVASRGLLGRVMLLDASRGDLAEYIRYEGPSSAAALDRRDASTPASDRDAGPAPGTAPAEAGRNGREVRP